MTKPHKRPKPGCQFPYSDQELDAALKVVKKNKWKVARGTANAEIMKSVSVASLAKVFWDDEHRMTKCPVCWGPATKKTPTKADFDELMRRIPGGGA